MPEFVEASLCSSACIFEAGCSSLFLALMAYLLLLAEAGHDLFAGELLSLSRHLRERLATGRDRINVLLALTKDLQVNDALIFSLRSLGLLLLDKGYPIRLCWLGYDGTIQGRYLAEEGELENAMDEILSISGKRDPAQARNAMESEYPGEAYIVVRHGNYKGKYIR